MSYITAHPELTWQTTSKWVSAALMYGISHMKLKKKYEITDERANLYLVLDEWVQAVGNNRFLGGSAPNRADLEVGWCCAVVRVAGVWDGEGYSRDGYLQ
eukprot:TRINITY_DN10589_c0_g1_i3.p1 TRINITY_DN10589_c0_g1~~TRINITY_DN10589_c0_g1_i3.p1  ORF type:complete len:100 (+),score=20.76 TRINITY_DN10589_c0_g1_i3:537-836(+)